MQTIFLDGDRYPNARALHQALKQMLNLPDHYGCNADALYDCLSTRRETVHAAVLSMGQGETADALCKCLMVVEDLGGQITKL